MSAPFDCPDLDCWQALLGDAVPPDRRESYERHLESCPACQERLHRADECGDALRDLGRRVGDPTVAPADPTLDQVLERLHGVLPTDRTAPREPAELDFLRPAGRPGVLGTLGNYEVREVLGQGGMGVVLKAFEPALHRLVAIKVMAAAVAGSATARRRFTREARAAAAVCHEHVVAVHGVHELEGLPYLVMQYVDGESLQARLDRTGPLEVAEVVRIGLQTASGLAAAHAQGLIHRDIKPANLLLEDGLAKVKITDFGLARSVDDVGLTRDGVVAGTPEYMAPEQARGEPVDYRADLFSLGSVLYATCTGRPPFRDSSAVAVLRRVSEEQPTSIRALNPEVPAWLEAVVLRLLAKDPAERFQSAAEVAALLEGYLAHLRQPATVPSPEPPPSPRAVPTAMPGTREKAGRVPSAALVVALVLAALGLGAFGFTVLLLGAGGGAPEAPPVNPAAAPFDVWSVTTSRDGKVVVGSGGMWDQPGEIGVWDLATGKPLQRFSEDLGVASVALSPDGKLLASGSWTGHVRLRDWAAGAELADFEVPGVARVAFSPDGELLATVTEGKTAQLWDVAQRKLRADLDGDLFRFHCVTFSPDGKRVLAGGGDWKRGGLNQVTVWDVAGTRQVLKLTGHENAILCITFSPDGKTIATGGVDNTVRLWDADSGAQLKVWRGHSHWVESVLFTADGKTLVSGSHDQTIRFWDVDQGTEKDRITMPGEVRALHLTADGNFLIAGGGQKTLEVFDAASHKEVAALWDGSRLQKVAMDELPPAAPRQLARKGWPTATVLVGLLIALALAIFLGVWLYARRKRRAGKVPARPFVPENEAEPEAAALPISFPCSGCGKNLKAGLKLAGKRVKCPQCGRAVSVPGVKPADSRGTPE